MLALFQRRLAVLVAILIGVGSLAGVAESAQPDESQIAVIASNKDSLPTISTNILREIYLKKIFVNSDGRPYIPVNLPATHQLRSAFLSDVLQMNAPQLQVYWDRRYFQGISPPYVLGSQRAVVKFVAMTPGAIGYVQRCHVTPEVHVILLVPLTGLAAAEMLEKCPDASAQ
jgi:ABC-type phosphate transport system substrate-binding protein